MPAGPPARRPRLAAPPGVAVPAAAARAGAPPLLPLRHRRCAAPPGRAAPLPLPPPTLLPTLCRGRPARPRPCAATGGPEAPSGSGSGGGSGSGDVEAPGTPRRDAAPDGAAANSSGAPQAQGQQQGAQSEPQQQQAEAAARLAAAAAAPLPAAADAAAPPPAPETPRAGPPPPPRRRAGGEKIRAAGKAAGAKAEQLLQSLQERPLPQLSTTLTGFLVFGAVCTGLLYTWCGSCLCLVSPVCSRRLARAPPFVLLARQLRARLLAHVPRRSHPSPLQGARLVGAAAQPLYLHNGVHQRE
jgi:hypothetical protein